MTITWSIDIGNAQRIQETRSVEIPKILRGSWFSWEGYSKLTVLDAKKMSEHGSIIDLQRNGSDYVMVFKDRSCYYCIKAFTR